MNLFEFYSTSIFFFLSLSYLPDIVLSVRIRNISIMLRWHLPGSFASYSWHKVDAFVRMSFSCSP